MANSTFIQIPMDVTNPLELRRFLDKLVEQLDVAFGNRGDGALVPDLTLIEVIEIVNEHEGRLDTHDGILNNHESRITALEDNVQDLLDGEPIITVVDDTVAGPITETILCNCISKDIDITLPNPSESFSSNRSKIVSISKIDGTDNIVTILPFGSESICGESSADLLAESEVINLITNGTDWYLGA